MSTLVEKNLQLSMPKYLGKLRLTTIKEAETTTNL